MSGGHFEYTQYHLDDISDTIKRDLKKLQLISKFTKEELKEIKNDWDSGIILIEDKQTIKEFKKAIKLLKKAAIYTQRIDWFLSGDDGEDTFHLRLKKELNK